VAEEATDWLGRSNGLAGNGLRRGKINFEVA